MLATGECVLQSTALMCAIHRCDSVSLPPDSTRLNEDPSTENENGRDLRVQQSKSVATWYIDKKTHR